jgi:phenylpropionate dioxygenase-like ring-hydroxylating dioxygenase large terminal subunit
MSSEKPSSEFVLNNWYVVGLAADISATPLARRICNLPLLFYRTQAGQVVGLADRCAHRGMPLSKGERSGDNIRCIYHGLEFDSAGACVKVPGQERIPAALRVRSYPVVEKDALVWVWTGDAAKADPAMIVSHPFHTDPTWVWTRGAIEVKANWQLLNDNLLDLSHLQYVHKKTIGGNPEEDQKAEVKAERIGNKVMITRWLRDMDAPPFHRQVAGFTGRIDRWQEIEFRPGVLEFYSGAMDANTGAFDGKRIGGMHIRHFHAITPETEHKTRYMFTLAHNFQTENAGLTEKMHQLAVMTFEEDQAVLEEQYARLCDDPGEPLVNIKVDEGVAHARRIVRELLDRESQPSSAPLVANAVA